MFRRFRRRRPVPPGLRPGRQAMRLLQEANGLMMAGRFVEAAERFELLAQKALQRGLPQAPRLLLRAAEARLKAGEKETARRHLEEGLTMLVNAGQWHLLRRVGPRIVAELQAQGHADLAAEVQQRLEQWLAQAPPPRAAQAPGALPTHCAACGAPVLPDEVDWRGATPVCAYCGTPLR